MLMKLLCNAPGYGVIIGDAHDESTPAGHQ
jgi:hypothetical protein